MLYTGALGCKHITTHAMALRPPVMVLAGLRTPSPEVRGSAG